jgi:hypothetical protein
MKNKLSTWLSLVIIVALSWIELQYFTESQGVDELQRKAAHILFLVAIMAAGYIAWAKHIVVWTRQIWLFSYIGAIVLITGIGLVQWKFQVFGSDLLDQVRDIRIFFSSPLPFLMLLAAPKNMRSRIPANTTVDNKA